MNIKAILFDADGVLITSDSFSTHYEKKFGLPEGTMLPFFKNEFQECVIGNADLKKVVKPYLIEWNWKGTTDEFVQYWLETSSDVDGNLIQTITNLRQKGISCYLATNQEKFRTKYLRNNMGFEEIFDGIFSSSEIGFKKPEEQFYRHICDEIFVRQGIFPHKILFIDDQEKYLHNAKELGINTHLYKNFEDLTFLLDKHSLN